MAIESIFGQLFLALQNLIKTKCPSVRWIDLDLGQLEEDTMRPAVSFPCVLIDFNQSTFEDLQRKAQKGQGVFTLRIGFASYSQTASTTPAPVTEKGLQFFEIENEVFKAVQGFEAEGLVDCCSRVNVATERREDGLRVRVMTFNFDYEDHSARVIRKAPKPDLDFCGHVGGLTVELNP
mgnify:CR=1 FL=1